MRVQLGEQGYQLEITDQITVSAATATGVFYGTQTLRQLLRQTTVPGGVAHDYPAYPERGVMLDTGRRYWQIAYLEQTLQRMAQLKLNVSICI
jgi:hexosaminidase